MIGQYRVHSVVTTSARTLASPMDDEIYTNYEDAWRAAGVYWRKHPDLTIVVLDEKDW